MGAGLTKFPHLLMPEQSHAESILVDFLAARNHYVDRRTELKWFVRHNESLSFKYPH